MNGVQAMTANESGRFVDDCLVIEHAYLDGLAEEF